MQFFEYDKTYRQIVEYAVNCIKSFFSPIARSHHKLHLCQAITNVLNKGEQSNGISFSYTLASKVTCIFTSLYLAHSVEYMANHQYPRISGG